MSHPRWVNAAVAHAGVGTMILLGALFGGSKETVQNGETVALPLVEPWSQWTALGGVILIAVGVACLATWDPTDDYGVTWRDGELGLTYALRCEAKAVWLWLRLLWLTPLWLCRRTSYHVRRSTWLFHRKGSHSPEDLTYEEWRERHGDS